MTEAQEQFKQKITVSDTGCWIWNGCLKSCRRGTHRYGWVTYNKKQMAAHRAAWIIFNGELPKGAVVCHKCDVPSCTNPDHLFVGTQLDNVRDMVAKGRKWKGLILRKIDGKPSRAKLSEADIAKIKELRLQGWTQDALAKEFKVCQKSISNLLLGRTNYAK
jgi:hypothetical protein